MDAMTPRKQITTSKRVKDDKNRGDGSTDRGVGIPTSSKPSHQNFGRDGSVAYQNDAQPLGSESKPLGGDGDKNSSSTTKKGPLLTGTITPKRDIITEGTRSKARKSGQITQGVVEKLGEYSALIPWLPEKIRH